jgi:prevent-host-death family protein
MKTVNIHDAKTNLSKLLEQVQRGEEVVIAKAGHPIAELKPYVAKRNTVKFGLLKGQIKYHGDIVGPDHEISDLFASSRVKPDGSV